MATPETTTTAAAPAAAPEDAKVPADASAAIASTSLKRAAEDVTETTKEDVTETEQEAAKQASSEPEAKKRKVDIKPKPLPLEGGGLLVTAGNNLALKPAIQDCLFVLRRAYPQSDAAKDTGVKQFEVLQNKKLPGGVGFVKCRITDPADVERPLPPTAVCEAVLQRFVDKKERSNHLGRLLPCDFVVSPPTLEAFQKVADEHIRPVFAAMDPAAATWALQFKTRSVKKITKEGLLDVIDKFSEGLKVSIDNPDVCILVDVNPVFMGVSLVKNGAWGKFAKYNLQNIQYPEKYEAEKQKQKAVREEKEGGKKVEEEKKEEGAAAVQKKEEQETAAENKPEPVASAEKKEAVPEEKNAAEEKKEGAAPAPAAGA
eukprot:g17331.t1